MGRDWVGVELNPEYVRIAERRTAQRGLWQHGAEAEVEVEVAGE